MEVADNKAVMKTDILFLFQTIQYIIHGRRTDVQHISEAAFGAVPALFAQLFGIGQAVDIRENSNVGK